MSAARMPILVALLLGLTPVRPAASQAAPEPAPPIAHPVNQALLQFNAHATFAVPLLDAEQLESLDQGDVLRIVERHADRDQPARALAFKLSAHPMQALWVASVDPHLTVDPDLIERRLSRTGHKELWYGYYDLPYPLSDRHWLVESWNNRRLARATAGRAWEHAWRLAEGRMDQARAYVSAGHIQGVTLESMDSAVQTPHNHGAWVVLRLSDGRSLLGYHATSTVGGSIPDWLVLQLVRGKLQALLERVDARCEQLVPSHYTASHPHLESGDGTPLEWRPDRAE